MLLELLVGKKPVLYVYSTLGKTMNFALSPEVKPLGFGVKLLAKRSVKFIENQLLFGTF